MSLPEEAAARGYDHRLMRRLMAYLRPYRMQVFLAVLVVLGDSLVGLAGPWLTKEAIDHGIRHRDLGYLDHVAVLYLSVLLVGFGLGYLQYVIMQRVGQRIMLDLRMGLFRHLQRLPLSFYDRNPIGRLMTRVTNDVDVLNELFTSGVVTVFGDVFLLVGIIIAMSQLNAELLAVTFSVLPLIFAVTIIFRARVRSSFRDIRTRLARMNAFLNENLTGMSTVQILNREKRNYGEFSSINASHRDANLQAVFYHALFFPLLELVGAVAMSLIIWYGGRQVMWNGITLGILVAFLQYIQRFFRPISDLSEKYATLQQAMASSERIFALLDTAPDAATPSAAELDAAAPATTPAKRKATPVPAAPLVTAEGDGRPGALETPPEGTAGKRGRIEFDDLTFAYRDQHWVLENVSFTVEPGEKVALVGATGSGKTTLASLLMRFYATQHGAIRVDGVPIDRWPIHELRRRIGFVLQDVFLFSGTIESNLKLGDHELSRERLVQAAREVHAHRFIERLPGGYDNEVVERGATFSAGQKQLLAFARALARDPEILILDEATSSVDTHTEILIQDALKRLMRDRTSLVIAHRLSTIQNVDRIVVLHHGRVREVGTHAQLLARNGIYARLYELQYLGRKPQTVSRRINPEGGEPPQNTPVLDSGLNLA